MSEMCHLYSVTCHIVYIVKSYSKSFSFHHLSQKHTKKIEKNEKMLLRIHPPNQGYLKAHSLYSNHFFRLVCSIAITTQKKNHIVHWMYVAAACHLFQSSDGPLSCCVGLAWLRMIMMCHYGAIIFYVSKIETQQKGRRGVAPTPDETLRTKGFATHLIISDHSVWFIVFLFVVHHVSSDHSQIKSSFMIHQICFIHFRVILCS